MAGNQPDCRLVRQCDASRRFRRRSSGGGVWTSRRSFAKNGLVSRLERVSTLPLLVYPFFSAAFSRQRIEGNVRPGAAGGPAVRSFRLRCVCRAETRTFSWRQQPCRLRPADYRPRFPRTRRFSLAGGGGSPRRQAGQEAVLGCRWRIILRRFCPAAEGLRSSGHRLEGCQDSLRNLAEKLSAFAAECGSCGNAKHRCRFER